jgi:hypothetical protein
MIEQHIEKLIEIGSEEEGYLGNNLKMGILRSWSNTEIDKSLTLDLIDMNYLNIVKQ